MKGARLKEGTTTETCGVVESLAAGLGSVCARGFIVGGRRRIGL
jgi:hypothetical protein